MVGAIAEVFALLQFVDDVGITGGQQTWENSPALLGYDALGCSKSVFLQIGIYLPLFGSAKANVFTLTDVYNGYSGSPW